MRKDQLLDLLREKGYSEEIILSFQRVPREDFIPSHLLGYAYDDTSLPLADGSRISQPSTLAFILKLLELKRGMSILEIGSGSGYLLALIEHIIGSEGELYGIEHNEQLAAESKKRFSFEEHVSIFIKDGSDGLPERAPFDRIIISASLPNKNIIYDLLNQLAEGGLLIVPIENSLYRFKKENGSITEESYIGYSFVPFLKY